MKTPITITAIIALHVAALGMIFVQPGCSSTNEPADTAPEIVIPATPDEPAPYEAPEGSVALRAAPTRPAFTLDDKKGGEVLTTETPSTVKPRTTVSAPAPTVASNDTIAPLTPKAPEVAPTVAPVLTPAPTPVESSIETEVYIVKKGDTLSKIASKNKMTVAQIKSVNNLKNDSIRIGQKLILNKSANPTIATTAKAQPAATPKAKADANATTYTVKGGDTLGAISKKYGVSVDTLLKNNGMSDPRKLRVGQVLYIKANDAPSAAVAPEVKAQPATIQDAPKAPTPVIQPDAQPAPAPEQSNPEIIEI